MAKYKGQSKGHGECRSLSREEVEKIQAAITPPLTQEELHEKQMKEYLVPDKSHITPWAP